MRVAIIVALVGCGFEHGRDEPASDSLVDDALVMGGDGAGATGDTSPGAMPACWTNGMYTAAPNGRKYRAPHSDSSWIGAQSTCAGADGHLVVINDAVENAHVQTIMDQDSWIGLADQMTDGTLTWVNGDSLSFTSWATAQPINPSGTTCVFIRKSDGKWRTGLCGTLEYVCECPYP